MALVGIFSREDTSCYQWLINALLESKKVKDIRPVLITNRSSSFEEEMSKCDFAILYHSKTRGRVNVTDVTDSLYDNELERLSSKYGKYKVLVVIDDLDISSDDEKARILQYQPSIGNYSGGLFIFSSADKSPRQYQQSAHVMSALDEMLRMIPEARCGGYKSWARSGPDGEDERIRLPSRDSSYARPERKISTRCCIFIVAAVVAVVIVVLSVSLSIYQPPAADTTTTPPVHSTVTPPVHTTTTPPAADNTTTPPAADNTTTPVQITVTPEPPGESSEKMTTVNDTTTGG